MTARKGASEPILRDIGFVGYTRCDFVAGQIWADEALCRFFNLEPFDAQPRPIQDFMRCVHADDEERAGPGRCTIVGSDGIGVFEYRVIGTDRAVGWVLYRAAYQQTDAGSLLSGQGVAFDIASSKTAEPAATMRERSSGNLDRIVGLLLQAKQEAEPLQSDMVGHALDLALVLVGRLLARDLSHESGQGVLH